MSGQKTQNSQFFIMNFHHTLEIYNRKTPEIVVPIIIEKFKPESVLDVGCGIGTWLSVFRDLGVHSIFGVDGDWVDRNLLSQFIDEKYFLGFDLSGELNLHKKFDTVLSLEVAAHISEEFADNFVRNLVNHGDVIVFSAAIPFQDGENHLNKQWPSYWIEKFAKFKLYPDNFLRKMLWENEDIEYWYRQNILVFTRDYPKYDFFDMVHPTFFLRRINTLNEVINDMESGSYSLRFYIRILIKKILKKLKVSG